MEGRLRANMLWDSIVRYKTERGALGSKLEKMILFDAPNPFPSWPFSTEMYLTTSTQMYVTVRSAANSTGRSRTGKGSSGGRKKGVVCQ
jgi:hypothetical protein